MAESLIACRTLLHRCLNHWQALLVLQQSHVLTISQVVWPDRGWLSFEHVPLQLLALHRHQESKWSMCTGYTMSAKQKGLVQYTPTVTILCTMLDISVYSVLGNWSG